MILSAYTAESSAEDGNIQNKVAELHLQSIELKKAATLYENQPEPLRRSRRFIQMIGTVTELLGYTETLLNFFYSTDDDWGEQSTLLERLVENVKYIVNTVNDGVVDRNCSSYTKGR